VKLWCQINTLSFIRLVGFVSNTTKLGLMILPLVVLIFFIAFSIYYDAEAESGVEPQKTYQEYQNKLKELRESIDKPSPKQQISSGIKYIDVMCSNNFVLLFKWSSNSMACVKPQSAEKLEKRGWGVPKDQTAFLGFSSLCWTDFTIHYQDINKYNEYKIIKTIRDALSKVDLRPGLGEYKYRWDYISILNKSDNQGIVKISIEGSYSESGNQLEKENYKEITQALQNMDGVIDVKPNGIWCN